MIVEETEFVSCEAVSASLARRVSHVLSKAVTENGLAVLAVSGGRTPTVFFEHLSQASITWNKVIVTLVDERQVPDTHPRSNAGLVKQHLLQAEAAKAHFVPLYQNEEMAAKLPPFAACIMGLGLDGHTASFFPGGDRLADAIDPGTDQSIVEMKAQGASEPRLTFTLPRLLAARFLALHFEGKDKKSVLDLAAGPGEIAALPIRAVLRSPTPLHVYWCP
jgi:6-phosphogluconolactonase